MKASLEDFADYYHSRKRRQDDPFALMEQHHIERKKAEILRIVDNFGCLRRRWEEAPMIEFIWPVRTYPDPDAEASVCKDYEPPGGISWTECSNF